MRIDEHKLPGNVLTINLKKIWEVIKEQKDLNLPAHKVRYSLHILDRSKALSHVSMGNLVKSLKGAEQKA